MLLKKFTDAKDKRFLYFILALVVIAGVVFNNQTLAMWFGFIIAGYSAISNDSIQTLGTFLTSNRKVKWYWLWLFIGGIMAAVFYYGWATHGGDASFGRLNKIPTQDSINFVQLLAPIVLLVLTHFKMPVSTTFLILATFSSGKTIMGMMTKTFTGYFLAFFIAAAVWGIVATLIKKNIISMDTSKSFKKRLGWRTLQWASTAFLWSAWLMQDNANALVFLPRKLSFAEITAVILFLFFAIGFMMYKRGGKIQTIIEEKTDVIYVKSATMIDLVYGCVLVYFKWMNDLPMSTTWVFLGLLAGREIALQRFSGTEQPYGHTLSLVTKDLLRAGFGLAISLLLAFLAQSAM